MARKMKPVDLLNSNAGEVVQKEIPEQKNDVAANGLVEDANPLIGKALTADQQDKLEKYDGLEKTVKALSQEKADLEAKLAEYVENSSENATEKMKSLEEENEKFKRQIESAKTQYSTVARELAKLKQDYQALREENDQYLVKISELTFENANMTCQLKELSDKMQQTGKVHNSNKFAPGSAHDGSYLARSHKDVYDPYVNNGYGTW